MLENGGGKIEVESKLGVGSTFKVYFKHWVYRSLSSTYIQDTLKAYLEYRLSLLNDGKLY
jgi:hypothetical protein